MTHTIPTPGTAGTIPAGQLTLDSGRPNATPLRATYVGRTPSPWTVYATGRPMAPLYALEVEGLGRFVVETAHAFTATFLPDAGEAIAVDVTAGPVPAPEARGADGLTDEQREYLAARYRACDPRGGAQRREASGDRAADSESHASGLPSTPDPLDAILSRVGITPEAALASRIRGAVEAAASAQADADYAADRATRSTVVTHLEACRTAYAAASALVEALDADYTSTLAERDAAAVADSAQRFRVLVAEEAAALTVAETGSGRRLEPDAVAYAVQTLRLDAAEAGGWSPSTLEAIAAAAARAAARVTRTRFER